MTGRDSAVRDVLVVLGGYLVLGLLCGVCWWLLVDPAQFTKLQAGGAMGELQFGRRFAADGWYVVIAGVVGLLSGMAMTWWRSRDPLLTTSLLLLGSGLAAGVMWLTGRLLGPGSPQAALAVAEVGALVPERLDVSATTAYLAWPIAVLAGALLVLLGGVPDPQD